MYETEPEVALSTVLYANDIVASLLNHSVVVGVSHRDLLISMEIAIKMLQATYPMPEQLFGIAQEAEATLELLVRPRGEPC